MDSLTQAKALRPRLEQAVGFAQIALRSLTTTHPDEFPMYTKQGQWSLSGERWTNWCEGFLGGQLWLLAQYAADPAERTWFRQQAENYSCLVEPRKADTNVHDLGFVFLSTWKRWFDLSGDPAKQAVVVAAGRTLAKRFQPNGRYLASFLGTHSLFIDIMMNVPIIFYAAKITGDSVLYQVAKEHCDTTRRCLVRADGSTAHEGLFDTTSGAFLGQSTQQGWTASSCWARGLAWSLYGFGTVYTYTQDPADLATAESNARYYMQHCPANGVPPNDFDESNPPYPYESSAAAIAAGGLWQLAGLVDDPQRAETYRSYALTILDTLTGPEFLGGMTQGWEGLLKHGIYHLGKNLGVDESVMWGDYFFLEMVTKGVGLCPLSGAWPLSPARGAGLAVRSRSSWRHPASRWR